MLQVRLYKIYFQLYKKPSHVLPSSLCSSELQTLLWYLMLSVTWALVPLCVQTAQLQGAAAAQHSVYAVERYLSNSSQTVNFRKEDDTDPPRDLIFSPNNSVLGKLWNSKWGFQRGRVAQNCS